MIKLINLINLILINLINFINVNNMLILYSKIIKQITVFKISLL